MEVVALSWKGFILIFSLDFIVHLRLCWALPTQQLLICGALAVLYLSVWSVFQFLLVKMKMTKWLQSWKS